MEYVLVLLPSLVVGGIFWFAMRAIFNADKSEREALAKAEEEQGAGKEHRRGEQAGGESGTPAN
ncbi:hypothetical protein [Sinomonas halotolerans]|uniref:Cbb3-type cytochrome oxidase assembly protein CcoS n=1 Tax=Sinomonas halotolerans TaxID=1644133 RepID=A0ABU9WX73_9MICC